VALFKAGVSILNETIRNSSMILINVSISIQNATQQAMSNLTACISSSSSSSRNSGFGFFFSAPLAMFTCTTTVIPQQFSAFISRMKTQIQSVLQIFSQLSSPSSLNSTVHTLPQMFGLGANLTASIAAQIAAIGAQAMECVAEGMSSAATAFSG
jgi:hypothetical protein